VRALVLALLLTLSPLSAGAETVLLSLSTSRVAITSNYTGSSVVAFGVIERDRQTVPRAGDYAVVVTVRGPRQTITVREKERFGPFWVNGSRQKFAMVPAYLAVLASRPLAEITGLPQRQQLRIGIEPIVMAPDFAPDRGSADDPYRDALVRLRVRERLYIEDGRGVSFITPTVFRSAISLPAAAPPGNYEVEVSLFADGALLARDQTNFELAKTGFEQRVGDLARDRALVYGLATGALALLFGWIASVIFRRD
jgi:uncharacterized protein (TIGR02186 family)